MSGGGGDEATTQTQRTEPSELVGDYLPPAIQALFDQYQNAPQYYPGSTVAGQGEATQRGITGLGDTADRQEALAGSTLAGAQSVFGSVDVANDPYLARAVNAAINPVRQQLTDYVLPQITDEAVGGGGLGGSRQGVAQSGAIDSFTRNAMDISSGMYSNALQSAYNNVSRLSLGLPSIQAGMAAPAQSLLQQGGIQDAYQQALINENMNRFNYEQNIGQSQASDLFSLLMGTPQNQTIVTTPPGSTINPYVQAGGAGIAAGTATSNPYVGLAVALGSLLLNN